MNKKRWKQAGVAVFMTILLMTGCFLSSSSENRGEEESGETEFFAMNTYLTFQAYGEAGTIGNALKEAQERVEELEKKWSVTNPDSEIYKLNHSKERSAVLSNDTAEVIRFALSMAEETGGRLEPTIYPVLRAWGFTTEDNRIPGQEELTELLEKTGYEKISMEGNRLTIPEGMEIDLGAVGKGYAGDEAAEVLKKYGIASALLNLGGNVQAVGSRPDGRDWRLGIRSPFGEGNLGVLEVSDKAVVTSGNYERYFVGEDGRTYGHIMNPDTGCPVDNDLMSMTIITDEGKRGDALSTSLFVMGLSEAEKFWRAHQDFEMLAVAETGEIYLTEGIENSFSLETSFQKMKIHVIEES